jgi:TrmH RNA methyltransferase
MKERPQRPHLAKDEIRYYGRNACLALWKNRPKDLIRVYVRRDLADHYAELLEDCARHRKSYHLVDEADLERLASSLHHQGVCVVAKERRALREGDFFREIRSERQLVLFLDGVGNPHNLGAILRSAAHFGVKYVAAPAEVLPRLSPAAARTSEGGGELVSLIRVEEPVGFLARMRKQGWSVMGLEPNPEAPRSLYAPTRLPDRLVFVLGGEVEGISPEVASELDASVQIPGTGSIESLNVSVAAALAMSEFSRQSAERQVRIVKKTD